MGSSWPPHGVRGPAAQQLCLSLPPPSVDGAASSGLRGRSEGPRAASFLTLTSGALGNPFPLFLSGSDPEQAPCKPSPRTRRLDVPAVLSMFVGGRACWRPGGVSEWGGPGALRWGRAERGVGPVQRPEGRGGEPGPWSEALRVRGQPRLRAGGGCELAGRGLEGSGGQGLQSRWGSHRGSEVPWWPSGGSALSVAMSSHLEVDGAERRDLADT